MKDLAQLKKKYYWLLFSLLFSLAITISIYPQIFNYQSAATEEIKNKKVLEFGWQTPSPTYTKRHIKEMEEIPFDGLIFDLRSNQKDITAKKNNQGNRFAWNMWGNKALNYQDYSNSIADLKETKFQRFTDNFLRFNVTPGTVDWYDSDFDKVIENASLIAQIAKQTGVKGIFLDTEQYREKIFRYLDRPYQDKYSFEEYKQQVTAKGKEIMEVINQNYPDVYILVTFGHSLLEGYQFNPRSLKLSDYGLLPAFLDGMLLGAKGKNLIFDGWEKSYGYTQEFEFKKARNIIYQAGYRLSQVKDKYRQFMRASFGLWLDYNHSWHTDDLTKNYFTPEKFLTTLKSAFKYSDRYVWIYSQKVGWWKGRVPQPYIEALKQAKES